jgi:hypothetical protein
MGPGLKMRQPNEPYRCFSFQPRWKEELVVTGPGGAFVLELPMGILSAYLPTESAWRSKAPHWAIDLWPVLKAELEQWCRDNQARLYVDEFVNVYPFPPSLFL